MLDWNIGKRGPRCYVYVMWAREGRPRHSRVDATGTRAVLQGIVKAPPVSEAAGFGRRVPHYQHFDILRPKRDSRPGPTLGWAKGDPLRPKSLWGRF